MELDELDHEAVVGAGDGTLFLYEGLGLFVVVLHYEHDVGDYHCDGTGDALDAVDQHFFVVF